MDLLGVLGGLSLGSRLLESEGLQLVLALLGDGELLAVLDLFLDWDLLADLVLGLFLEALGVLALFARDLLAGLFLGDGDLFAILALLAGEKEPGDLLAGLFLGDDLRADLLRERRRLRLRLLEAAFLSDLLAPAFGFLVGDRPRLVNATGWAADLQADLLRE